MVRYTYSETKCSKCVTLPHTSMKFYRKITTASQKQISPRKHSNKSVLHLQKPFPIVYLHCGSNCAQMEYELHTTHERGGAVLEDKHRLEDQVATLQNAQMSLQAHMQQLQVFCRSGSGLNHLFRDSSPLGDMKKYAIKVCHDVKCVL